MCLHIELSTTHRLRKRVFAAVLHRRLAFFDATRTGELLNRLSNDVTQASLGGCRTGLCDAMPCGRSRSIAGDGLIAAHSHYIQKPDERQNQVSKTLSADTSYFLRNFAQVSTAKRRTRKVLFESSIATGSRLTEVLSESSIATGSRHPTLPRPFTQSTDTRAPARWA